MKALLGNLLKLGVLCAIGYGLWTWWYQQQDAAGGASLHAERACIDAIRSRYTIANAKVFKVTENRGGLTIRASGSRADGTAVRLICLTTRNGTVKDISLEHR